MREVFELFMNSKNITATSGRLNEVMKTTVDKYLGTSGVEEKIIKAVDKASVRTGVVTKIYPYLDKVEVKLDTNKKKVLCKNLHKFGGDLLDLYTPLAESKTFCDKLKEPCIIPRLKLHCAVLSIHDADSKEELLLGYYQNEELIGLVPAEPGNIKIASVNDINQYWIKFGRNGLDLRLPSKTTGKVGGLKENMTEIDYDNSNLYSKKEVDAMFKEYETKLKNYEDRIKTLEEAISNSEDTNTGENTTTAGGE